MASDIPAQPAYCAAAGYLAVVYLEDSTENSKTSLRLAGTLIATIALVAITWALTDAVVSDAHARQSWMLGIGGLALLVLFVIVEARRGDRAIMPIALFANRTFSGLTLLTFFLYASLSGLLVLLPFLMIRVGGYSAVQAGAAILPLAIMIGLGSRFMGRMAGAVRGTQAPDDRFGDRIVGVFFLPPRRCTGGLLARHPAADPCDRDRDGHLRGATDNGRDVFGRYSPRRRRVRLQQRCRAIAGLIATALLGSVFVLQGSPDAFTAAFHDAALVASASALAAAASAFFSCARQAKPTKEMSTGAGKAKHRCACLARLLCPQHLRPLRCNGPPPSGSTTPISIWRQFQGR